ncbi:MAG TPA: PQQ-binding-like beta-propeller repeat protein, partial [Thermoanaerobaculia bacterium]|nr:PQQ-binding-like beta-propeller repeat protein [Thermoanaerobaculia bacterium]
MTRKTLLLALLPAAALAALPLVLAAEDWPQWLGPRSNGSATGVLAAPAGAKPVQLRKLWQRPAEKAGSSLVAVGDRVYTLEAHEGADFAVALDAATGREAWRVRIDASDPGALEETGPNSTPAVADGRVFALGTACRLMALDAATGRVLWQQSLKEKFGTGQHRVGCQTSPLPAGDRLIVQASGDKENRLVALAPDTGAVVWTSKGVDRTSSSSPVLAEIGGERQVVVHYRDLAADGISGLYGARLADGEVLWSVRLDQGSSVDTPLVLPGDRIVLQTWSDARLFQVKKEGGKLTAAQVWSTDALRAASGPPVFHDGHLYGFGQDFLACVDAATGKPLWKQKLYAGAIALADGHLIAVSPASGQLHIAEATPAG